MSDAKKKITVKKRAQASSDETKQPTPTKTHDEDTHMESEFTMTKIEEEEPVVKHEPVVKQQEPQQEKPKLQIPAIAKPIAEPVVEVAHEKSSSRLNAFYCNDHYWDGIGKPHTIIIAAGLNEADAILDQYIKEKYPTQTNLVKPNIAYLPINQPGVAVLSIGLGELGLSDEKKEKFQHRPIVENHKSQATQANAELYYCNTHYTSSVTPAASVIIAKDSGEAVEFMLKVLKSIGTGPSPDLMVYRINQTTPGVHFLVKSEEEEDDLPMRDDYMMIQSTGNMSFNEPPMWGHVEGAINMDDDLGDNNNYRKQYMY